MRRPITIALAILLIFLLSACRANQTDTPTGPELIMMPEISMEAGGEMVLRTGIRNTGQLSFPGSEVFDAVITIVNERGELVSDVRLKQMNPVSGGETVFPAEIRTVLPPGSYSFTWATPGYETVSFNFTVVERDGVIILQSPAEFLNPHTEFTEIDPSL